MIEVMKYTIPALLVMLTAWLVLHRLYREEDKKRRHELNQQRQRETLPRRLQAYERMALLLERTQPEHLLADMDLGGLTAQQLCSLLLQKVRMEFDHNLSQQIYLSETVWAQVMNAREQILLFIGTTSRQFPADAPATDAAKLLLEAYAINGETPHQSALRALKNEARTLMA